MVSFLISFLECKTNCCIAVVNQKIVKKKHSFILSKLIDEMIKFSKCGFKFVFTSWPNCLFFVTHFVKPPLAEWACWELSTPVVPDLFRLTTHNKMLTTSPHNYMDCDTLLWHKMYIIIVKFAIHLWRILDETQQFWTTGLIKYWRQWPGERRP